MTKELINDPAHWCERAAEGRRTADQMTDPMSQGMMLAIVDDYSRLAERAQRLVVPKPGTLLWAACSNSLREGDDRCRRPHQLGRAWAGHSGPVVSRPPAPRRERKRCRRRSRPRAADRRPHRGVEKRLQLRTHRHRRCGEGRRAIRTNQHLLYGHGLPMRGNSHPIIRRYGSALDGIRSIAFLAKGSACSSVCRLSFASDIHSRMIFRRVSCSGFMLKIPFF
jgi:hypothetical protein